MIREHRDEVDHAIDFALMAEVGSDHKLLAAEVIALREQNANLTAEAVRSEQACLRCQAELSVLRASVQRVAATLVDLQVRVVVMDGTQAVECVTIAAVRAALALKASGPPTPARGKA